MQFWALLLLPTLAAAYVVQNSLVGPTASMQFDVTEAGSAYECGTLEATGTLQFMNVNISFAPVPANQYADNFASDMFIAVTSTSSGECAQLGGYDFVYPGCGEVGKFPSRWDSNKPGVFAYDANVTKAFISSTGGFTICVGNGYEGSGTTEFKGTVALTPLTTTGIPPTQAPTRKPTAAPSTSLRPSQRPNTAAPSRTPTKKPSAQPSSTFRPTKTPIVITSQCNNVIAFDYSVVLSGAQKVCQWFGASGKLTDLFATLTFGGGTTVEYAGDMAMIIYDEAVKEGIQVGGYDYFAAGITYVGPWPSDWQTTAAGTYTASIDNLDTYNLASTGFYYVCILNGWKYAAKTSYIGDATLNGLSLNCGLVPPNPTVAPSSAPTITFKPTVAQVTDVTVDNGVLALNYDFSATGGQQFCKTINVAGAITAVTSQFSFTPTKQDSYAQDLYITITNQHAGSCVQVGGYDVAMCGTVYQWPNTFDKATVGTYSATVSVNSNYLNAAYAPYTVCYGNGYAASASVTYSAGTSSFPGLSEDSNRQYVTQTSAIGQGAMFSFDVQEPGSGTICGNLASNSGSVKYFNISMYFNPMSSDPYVDNYASDMFMTISNLDVNGNAVACTQYGGYDFVSTGCTKSGLFPTTWESNKAGNYAFNGPHSQASTTATSWKVCIGNGYKGSSPVLYEGYGYLHPLVTSAVVPTFGPTRAPSMSPSVSKSPITPPTTFVPTRYPTRKPTVVPTVTFKPTSKAIVVNAAQCGAGVTFTYDAVLKGTQKVCTYFGAQGSLNTVNTQLIFPGADTVEYPGDMGLIVYDPALSKGIQIGGYDYYIDGISYVGPWPASWQTTDAGTYNANIDVSAYGLTGTGYYYACIFNGWYYGAAIDYSGSGSFPALTNDCTLVPAAPTAKPTHQPTITYAPTQSALSELSEKNEVLDIRFDVSLSGSQQKCITVGASDAVTKINASYTFTPTGTDSYASDLYITIQSDQVESCLQVGGYNVKMCGATASPSQYFSWPAGFSSTAKGNYKAVVDITSSLYAKLQTGSYEVCYGNGYTTSAAASYKGTSSLPSLISADVYCQAGCDDRVKVSFDTYLAGKEFSCTNFGADENLNQVQISMQFGGSTGDSYASDFALVVFNNLTSYGIQVGGDDYNYPNIVKKGSWPASWDSYKAGSYSATVDLQGPFFGGKGYYRVCVVNGYVASEGVSYQGTASLNALSRICGGTYTPKPTPTPTPKPSSQNSVTDTSSENGVVSNNFALNLVGGAEDCISIELSGSLTEVSARVLFVPSTGDSYASDFYITVKAASAVDCIQIGGYDINYCTIAYAWPQTWQSGVSNSYLASVPISDSEYANLGATTYEICYGNGEMASSSVSYTGSANFDGLNNDAVTPSSDSSSNNNSKTIVLAVVIPLVILFVAGLGAYWYFYCRKGAKPSTTKSNLSSPYAAYEDNEEAPVAARNGNSSGSYAAQGVITNPLLQKG